jgi:CRISPR/Cas system CSM-associated protein Csm3 (group 7 of RAMP superfamily)
MKLYRIDIISSADRPSNMELIVANTELMLKGLITVSVHDRK